MQLSFNCLYTRKALCSCKEETSGSGPQWFSSAVLDTRAAQLLMSSARRERAGLGLQRSVPRSIHAGWLPERQSFAPFHPWVHGSQCPVPPMGAWLPERQSCVPRAGTSLPTGEDTLFILFLTCPKQRRLFWILKEFCGKTAGCVVLREAAVRDVCAELCREQAALLQILPCLC